MLIRAELQLLSNGSSDAGPWLRQALVVPFHPTESSVRQTDEAHVRHELVLNALRQLSKGLAGEASYPTGLCAWAVLVSPSNIMNQRDQDSDFVAALTERHLSPRFVFAVVHQRRFQSAFCGLRMEHLYLCAC